MSDKRKSNLMGVKPTLDINPLTRDFKQPESVLKKTAKSGPSMAEIGAVVGLGAAAGYAGGKKGAKDVMEKESEKTTKKPSKESPMKGKPAGGKKKGMNQEERRKYFGVKKRNTGGMSKDRLTEKDIETAETAIGKSGDRLTKSDIEKATRAVEKRSTGGKVQKAFMGLAVEAMKNSKGVRDVASNLGIGPRLLADYFDKKESKPTVEQKVAKKSLGGEMKRGYGAARQKGMGLEDEGLGLEMGKGSDYIKDLL